MVDQVVAGLLSSDPSAQLAALRAAVRLIAADAEAVASLGAAGAHARLLVLLQLQDEAAAAEAVDACVRALPAGASFPMRARPVSPSDVAAASLSYDLGRCPLSRERLTAECRRLREPSGARRIGNMPWLSGLVLARWCVAHAAWLQAQSVLELGSGLGLAGLAAARYAGCATLTDFDPEIVRNLSRTIAHNAAARDRTGAGDDAGAARPGLLPAARAAATSARLLDWHSPQDFDFEAPWPRGGGESRRGFDVVLGADVVHERPHAAAILNVLRAALAAPGRWSVIVNPAEHHRAGMAELRAELAMEAGTPGGLRALRRPIGGRAPGADCDSESQAGLRHDQHEAELEAPLGEDPLLAAAAAAAAAESCNAGPGASTCGPHDAAPQQVAADRDGDGDRFWAAAARLDAALLAGVPADERADVRLELLILWRSGDRPTVSGSDFISASRVGAAVPGAEKHGGGSGLGGTPVGPALARAPDFDFLS